MWLVGTTVVLLALGVVMVYSASAIVAAERFGDPALFLRKQLLWAVLGALALVAALRVDYRRLEGWGVPALLVAAGLLVLVLVPPLAQPVNGTRRWLRLGPLSVQPAEFAKLALVLFLAGWLARHRETLADFRRAVLPPLAAAGALAALVVLQPDLGSTIVLVLTAWTLLFLAGAPVWHILLVGGAGLAAILALSLSAPYRLQRVMAFLDPSQDPLGIGWHIIQATIALGSGGLLGRGLGASRQKFYYLPSAHTDAIFAVIGEELGFLGTTAVLGLLAVLAYRGLQIALQAPDTYGGLLAAGITTWLVCQALINIGVVTAVLPFTGIPLPFVSFGGSSLVVSLAAIGIVLNIARQSVHEESS